MAIIEGTAYWASLTRPNEKFEPMWRIDLAVDSKDAEDFKGQGISVAETTIDEKTIPNIIRFKRKVQKANGDKNQQPQLVDADKKQLDKIVNAQSHISNNRGIVGARVNSLQRQSELLIERQNAVEKDVSDLSDADLSNLVTNLQSMMTSMQASQQAFVKVSQLNLFDYIR